MGQASKEQSPEDSRIISVLDLPKTHAGYRAIAKSEWEMDKGIIRNYRRSVLIRPEDFNPDAFLVNGQFGDIDIEPISGNYLVDISIHQHLSRGHFKYVEFDGSKYIRITPKNYSDYPNGMKRAELLFDNLGGFPVFMESENRFKR